MIKRKNYYYYDPETCTYVPASVSPQVIARKVLFWAVFVAGFGLAAKFGFDQFAVGLQEGQHARKQEKLLAVLEEMNGRLDSYDASLAEFYKKNNSLYRPVVGNGQIPLSYWNGGRGGTSRYDRTSHNEVNQTQIRIERASHQIDLLSKSYADVEQKMVSTESELRNLPSIMPSNGALISGFGFRRHPVSGHQKFHEGLDFACQIGTPVYAPGDAVVESSGYIGNGYGININLDHQNGYKTKFAHLSQALVTDGTKVKRGQLIGYSGNTGLSTGPHLHYEIMFNDVKIDPIDFFYDDLPPNEYRRLKLNKAEVTKEAVKERLSTAPAMD